MLGKNTDDLEVGKPGQYDAGYSYWSTCETIAMIAAICAIGFFGMKAYQNGQIPGL